MGGGIGDTAVYTAGPQPVDILQRSLARKGRTRFKDQGREDLEKSINARFEMGTDGLQQADWHFLERGREEI